MRKMLTISVGLRLHSQLQIHTTKSSNLKYIHVLLRIHKKITQIEKFT